MADARIIEEPPRQFPIGTVDPLLGARCLGVCRCLIDCLLSQCAVVAVDKEPQTKNDKERRGWKKTRASQKHKIEGEKEKRKASRTRNPTERRDRSFTRSEGPFSVVYFSIFCRRDLPVGYRGFETSVFTSVSLEVKRKGQQNWGEPMRLNLRSLWTE